LHFVLECQIDDLKSEHLAMIGDAGWKACVTFQRPLNVTDNPEMRLGSKPLRFGGKPKFRS
jgi:hypothetical protein